METELVELHVEGGEAGGQPDGVGRAGERQLDRVPGEPSRGDEHLHIGVLYKVLRVPVRGDQRDAESSRIVGIESEQRFGHRSGEPRVARGREVRLERVVDRLPGERIGRRCDERAGKRPPTAQGEPAGVLVGDHAPDTGSPPTGRLVEQGRRKSGRGGGTDAEHGQVAETGVALEVQAATRWSVGPLTEVDRAVGVPQAEHDSRQVPTRFQQFGKDVGCQRLIRPQAVGGIDELDYLVEPAGTFAGLDGQAGRGEDRPVDVHVHLGHVAAFGVEEPVEVDPRHQALVARTFVDQKFDAPGSLQRTRSRPLQRRAGSTKSVESPRPGRDPDIARDRQYRCRSGLDSLADAHPTLDRQHIEGRVGRGLQTGLEGTVGSEVDTVLRTPFNGDHVDRIPGPVGLPERHSACLTGDRDNARTVRWRNDYEIDTWHRVAIVDLFGW